MNYNCGLRCLQRIHASGKRCSILVKPSALDEKSPVVQIVLKLALNIEQVRTVVGRRQVIYDKKNLLPSWGKPAERT